MTASFEQTVPQLVEMVGRLHWLADAIEAGPDLDSDRILGVMEQFEGPIQQIGQQDAERRAIALR